MAASVKKFMLFGSKIKHFSKYTNACLKLPFCFYICANVFKGIDEFLLTREALR